MLTEWLKEHTKTNHHLLEKKLVAKMRAMRSTNDYAELLISFYRYIAALEKKIAQHLDQLQISDYPNRRKAAALAADLGELGVMLPVTAFKSELPTIINHQQALGALYVLEGSTLGGKIISKMINHQLPSMGGHSLTFFNSYGDDTERMWQEFKLVLDRPEYLPGDELIASANETFLKFSQFFD